VVGWRGRGAGGTDRIGKPPFYAVAGGLAMGCGEMAELGMSWLVVAVGGYLGAWQGRWAQAYADRLDAGEPATAPTLWAAAAEAPFRRWRPLRDAAMAASLGLVAGLLAAGGSPVAALPAIVLAALAWIDARSGLLPGARPLPLLLAGWPMGGRGLGA